MHSDPSVNLALRRAIRAALTGSSLAAMGVAHGQTQVATPEPAAEAPQEIVITGSRIAAPNQTSISPVTQVTAAAIEQTGVTRVEDLLNELPQVFAAQNSTAANGASGTATINLRGLGASRTLVLVNGQRLGPGDPGTGSAADINFIPAALIDSIDILTGGASSTYGADAVAGVVNFKLNDHFQGVKVVGDLGSYQHDNSSIAGELNQNVGGTAAYPSTPGSIWEGTQREISIIGGLNSEDNKGNATVYFTYRNILPVLEGSYSYAACTLGSGYLKAPTNGQFTCGGSATAYPMNILLPVSPAVTWAGIGPNGTIVPGANGGNGAAYEYNYGALNYYQRPDERYTGGAFLHYDFNEHVTFYSQTMFMEDYTAAQIAGSGLFGDSAAEVNCANPFLSAQQGAAIGCATVGPNATGFGNPGTYLLRRDVEGGGRVASIEHTDLHEVLGVKGKINDVWGYDVSYNYWLTDTPLVNTNYFSAKKAANALDVVTGADGTPQCAVGPPCVPYNPFQTGGVTQAALNYLYTPGIQLARIYQHDAQVNLNADLGKYGLQLPTASSGLQLAFGGEYRMDKESFLPDEETQTGDLEGTGGQVPPISGSIIAKEGYLEAQMPIAEDKPFAKAIDLNAGYRYSSYSLGFNTNTDKIGLDWSPSSDVRLRATYTRAVRAPNISELFGPDSVGLDATYTADPCGPSPLYTAAQCEHMKNITAPASGQPGVAGYTYGSGALTNPAGQYNGLLGGNTALKPETAITKSFGIGLTPSFIPNFRAQIDYYDIKISNVIEQYGGAYILAQCALSDQLCNLINRLPNGSLWGTGGYLVDTLANVGTLEEEGVDFDIGYSFSLGNAGKVVTAFDGTYVDKFAVNVPNGAFDCAGYEGPICASEGPQNPLPHWRHRLSATWETPYSGLDLTLIWRYIGHTTLESLSQNPALNGSPGGTVASGAVSNTDDHIPIFEYFDLSAGLRVDEHLYLRVGVLNILDKSPPLIGSANIAAPPTGNGNTYPGMYDALGRSIFGEITAQF